MCAKLVMKTSKKREALTLVSKRLEVLCPLYIARGKSYMESKKHKERNKRMQEEGESAPNDEDSSNGPSPPTGMQSHPHG